ECCDNPQLVFTPEQTKIIDELKKDPEVTVITDSHDDINNDFWDFGMGPIGYGNELGSNVTDHKQTVNPCATISENKQPHRVIYDAMGGRNISIGTRSGNAIFGNLFDSNKSRIGGF